MSAIHSMTGYASLSTDLDSGHLSLELRAVNSRFLEFNFRMPDDLRSLESVLRERISACVARGKLECRINFQLRTQASQTTLDPAALLQLVQLTAQAHAIAPTAPPLSLGEILRWPGILNETAVDVESVQKVILERLDTLLADFNASRAREGEKLAAVLRERSVTIRAYATQLRPRVPEIVAAYREKLQQRLSEITHSIDSDRILQEVALYAQKVDVDEEIDRLLAHLSEIERTLNRGGTAGKRLDFLMQELGREANTLGSKAGALDIAHIAVELKVLIEQMREQIQNIE